MKKLLLIAFGSFQLFSCSSIEKDARAKIEQHIKENAHDAKSYEFISMGKPDTLKLTDSLSVTLKTKNNSLKFHKDMMQSSMKQVAFYENVMAETPNYAYIFTDSYERNKKDVAEYAEEVKKDSTAIQEVKSMIDNIKANPELNKIQDITYLLNFRIKNLMGALFKTHATIKYFPANNSWGPVEMTPNPIEGTLSNEMTNE
jgi:hypothetical protein